MKATLLLALGLPSISHAADEAERQVWQFRNPGEAMAWTGNGPLPHGAWPVEDASLKVTATPKGNPSISRSELLLPAEQANVVRIPMDVGNARKCRLGFATDVSPSINAQKIVDFELQPDVMEYNLDLTALPAWKNQVTMLRFDFPGLKEGECVGVRCIQVFTGEKISKPMVYTTYRPGGKPVVKEFRAGSLFNSNMVLQRDRPLPVWGRAKPGEAVTVRFAGMERKTTTDANGKWSVTLDGLPASCAPLTMEIARAAETLSFTNVVVGDVWLCGGQSNMGGAPQDNAPPAERRKELLETDYPNFRYVAMPGLHRETPLPNDAMEEALGWQPVRAAALRGVSAVSYYFGQSAQSSQKIPVGLVFIIKAGSQVEQWISRDTLRSLYSEDELQNISGHRLASGLHNGMIAPIAPFPIRGAIWYQGEPNADNEFKVMAYEGDPTNLHPNNKYFVGTRLGLVAREMVYGEKLESYSPIHTTMERRDAMPLRGRTTHTRSRSDHRW